MAISLCILKNCHKNFFTGGYKCMKKKIELITILLIVCVGALTACTVLKLFREAAEVVFEGGNIALQYDPQKWKLGYQKKEPYSAFCLEGEEDYIFIVPLEGDSRILEAFHEEFLIDMYMFSQITSVEAEEKIDQWEEKGYWYYIDDWNAGAGQERWITFEKNLGSSSIIGVAQINGTESDSEEVVLREKTNEALTILSSITYSERDKIKGISERNDLLYFYMMILEAEQMGEATVVTDRSRDYVSNEEAAKKMAEAFLDENDPGWKDNVEYEVEVIFIEQIYKWIVYYHEKSPEGTMVLDGSARMLRIRRDNGEVSLYYAW